MSRSFLGSIIDKLQKEKSPPVEREGEKLAPSIGCLLSSAGKGNFFSLPLFFLRLPWKSNKAGTEAGRWDLHGFAESG